MLKSLLAELFECVVHVSMIVVRVSVTVVCVAVTVVCVAVCVVHVSVIVVCVSVTFGLVLRCFYAVLTATSAHVMNLTACSAGSALSLYISVQVLLCQIAIPFL